MTTLFAAVLALACLPATGSAAAQGPWQLPAFDLSVTGQTATQSQIAIAADGTAIAVWERYNGTNHIIQATFRPPGGTFAAPVNLSLAGQNASDPQIAIAPDGTAAAVWKRSNGTNKIIQAAIRLPGGSFGAPEDLSVAGQDASAPHVAIAPDGTTTAVWTRPSGSDFITQAAIRPPGGSFGAPGNLSVAGRDAFAPRIASAPDGTTIAVWYRYDGTDYIIQAAIRPPGGLFGGPANLSVGGQDAFDPQIAFAFDGTATAVWEGSNGTDNIIQAATRPPGGTFGAPEDLSVAGQDAVASQVASASDGTTTAVWEGSNGTDNIIQAATRPPGGTFGAPEDLSAAGQDAVAPQVAAAYGGGTTAVWYRSNGTNYIIQSASRPRGGPFAASVDLSVAGQSAFDPQIAIAPDGSAAAVWYRYNGTNYIVQQASTEQPTITLNVTKTGTGIGTVTSNPAGIKCGSDCTEDYLSYTKVTLTARPKSGSIFAGWSGACEGETGNNCEVTMVDAAAAQAKFSPNCKKATLKLTKVKKNKKNGTAKLIAKVGAAGKLILKGSKNNKRYTKKAKKAGRYKLTVKAKGKAARKLRKKGRYKLKARVVFKPSSHCSSKSKSKKVKLVRRG